MFGYSIGPTTLMCYDVSGAFKFELHVKLDFMEDCGIVTLLNTTELYCMDFGAEC